jgi:hypothetical protein
LKHRACAPCRAGDRQRSFLSQLHRQGVHRWLALLSAAVLLGWLWMFAGQARHPEGVKRQWAVLASRLLVVAGGIFLVRLLLFSHEERIPVIFITSRRTSAGGEAFGRRIRSVTALRRKGYELIPLRDIVMFVGEHRYVPKRCFGLVIETRSPEELGEVLSSVGAEDVTVVLDLDVLEACEGRHRLPDLPETVTLGAVISGSEEAGAPGLERTEQELTSFADLATKILGKKPEYAVVEGCAASDIRVLLKATGYTCFLDGLGYNRFGDESHALRLMDVSHLLAGASLRGLRIMLHVAMFKGAYIVWPLAAVCNILCAR